MPNTVDIRQFVDINITRKDLVSVGLADRDTIALIASQGTAGVVKTVTTLNYKTEYADQPQILTYLDVFFKEGGIRCKVYEGISSNQRLETISNLPTNLIIIGIVGLTLSEALTIDVELEKLVGIHRKKLLVRLLKSDVVDELGEEKITPVSTNNILWIESEHTGYEMTIGAYLSKIPLDRAQSVKDFCYTLTSLDENVANIDTNYYTILKRNNINVILELANTKRIVGGNTANGEDLVNSYMLIVVTQFTTDAILRTLLSKIKGNQGLAGLRSSLTRVLYDFVNNGYLIDTKIWTNEDWVVEHNDRKFTIITKSTLIQTGFHIQVLPFTALSATDMKNGVCPPIYIVLADRFGIRTVVIEGGVI